MSILPNLIFFCSLNMPRALASSLQVNLVQTPSKYLGINFKLRGKWIVDFQFLVDRINSNFQCWKAKLLSQAGTTTLISSVLQSMPLYTFSCFRVPETICNTLDSNMERVPNWQEKTMIADLLSLQQNGLVSKLFFVSKVILGHVYFLASLATKMPTHYYWS